MTIRNFGGWEEGDSGAALSASGSVSIQTSVKRTGDYALRINPSASTGQVVISGISSAGINAELSETTLYCTAHIRMESLPGSTVRIGDIHNLSGTVLIRIRMNSSGEIFLSNAAESSDSAVAATLAADTWYRMEVKAVRNGTCELKIEGGSVVTLTGADVNADRVRYGSSSNQTIDMYMDDWAFDDGDYVGQCEVKYMQPDGDGNYQTGFTTGSGTTFAEIDERPHDSATTRWASITSGDVRGATFQSAAAAGINGDIISVIAWSVTRRENSTSGTIGLRIRSGSTDLDGSASASTFNVWTHRRLLSNTDPATSAAWDSSGLDGIDLSVRFVSGNAVACSALGVMVLSVGSGPQEIALAGDQPASTGAVTIIPYFLMSGNQPAATGVLTGPTDIALDGNQPAPSGTLSGPGEVTLSGNQPAPSGAITFLATSPVYTPWGSTIERLINPSDWGGAATAVLEVHGKTSDSGFSFFARLYNVTTSTAVSGSEISSNPTSKTRLRSSAFSFAAGDNVYRVEFGGPIGATYTMYDAVLISEIS